MNAIKPTEPAEKRVHLDFLDGLRGVCAIYVMIYHASLIGFWGDRQPSSAFSILTGWMGFGYLAVPVFIVISGFCLMIPVARNGMRFDSGVLFYLKKRFLRILPTYYIALMFSLLLVFFLIGKPTGTLWDQCLPVTSLGIIAHLLMLHNIHGAMQINSVMWSIAVEWQIYFLFPVMVYLWNCIGVIASAFLIVIVSFCISIALLGTKFDGLYSHFSALFLFGALISFILFGRSDGLRERAGALPWGRALFLLTVILLFLVSKWSTGLAKIFLDGLVGLWAAFLFMFVSTRGNSIVSRIFSSKIIASVGMFSYSLYLIHLPVQQLVWQYVFSGLLLNNDVRFVCFFLFSSAVILLLSYGFYRIFELPFVTLIKRMR